MAVVQRKLLLDCVLDPCGHAFKCWTKTQDDGTWEIHFHAQCAAGEEIARSIRDKLYPAQRLVRGD